MSPTGARNFSISENVIRGSIFGANASNLYFSKNIVEGSVEYFNGNSSFFNNDFIGLGNCAGLDTFLNSVSSITFENNIFLFSATPCSTAAFFGSACNTNTFSNNLFKMPITFPIGTNIGNNNIMNQSISSIFVNAIGDVFSYTENYHLKSTSPGIHAGSDFYDVGVYGTIQPYKVAAIPFNPHIRQKAIGTSTNLQGQLNIQIRVAAQDN